MFTVPDLLSQYIANPPKLVGPDYNIYRYTDQIYKVVKFKRPRDLTPRVKPIKSKEPSEKKPESSLSRARRNVLELALCNDWKYFCTFTLDKSKYDRFNLGKWHADFSQWIRDQRKKFKKLGQDLDIPFLLVPELHADGAWHMHGLLGDISPFLCRFYWLQKSGYDVPDYLVDNNFYCWLDYWMKFGFCSLGRIDNKVACGFYVSKYISKNLQTLNESLGVHTYYCSRRLNRASLHGSVYSDCCFLDRYLVNDYEWVKTGMTNLHDGASWDFAMEYMDSADIAPLEVFSFDHLEEDKIQAWEAYFEGMQMAMEGFT